MQFLLHGSLTAAVADALVRHEQKVHPLADAGVNEQSPAGEVVAAARAKQWDLITNDAALAEAIFERHLRFGRCLVYLQLEGGDVEQDDAIDRLFKRYRHLTPGRMYTVTQTRVKVRQLPTTPIRQRDE